MPSARRFPPAISEPIPHLVALRDRVGLASAFGRIIDHAKMQFHAVDRAVDRGVAEAAFGRLKLAVDVVAAELDQFGIAQQSGTPAQALHSQSRKRLPVAL